MTRDHTVLMDILERARDEEAHAGPLFGKSFALFDRIMLRKVKESDDELNRYARMVTRVMGEREDVEPFVEVLDLRRGDVLVLGTSGLCDWLEDVGVHAPPIQKAGPGRASESFLNAAVKESSGKIDVGVVVACFDDPALPPPAPEDVVPDRNPLLLLESLEDPGEDS